MTVELSSLRVSAQMDASQYAAGAAQKVAADKAMIASSQATGAAVTQTETKISQAGDVLSRLSRQYVDGYAAAQRFNSALNQLSNGLERGKISAEQTGPILDGIFRKYGLMGDAAQFAARGQTELAAAITRANAKLAEQRNINPVNQNQGGLARFGSLNATSQFQDIAITSAMGQSPFTIALQQGTQLGMALEQQLGDQGAKGLVKGLGSAFMGLLTPINLIAIGLTGAVAVAIQFGSKLLPQVKSLKDATEDQRKAVNDLAEAYGNAGLKADEFYKKSAIAAGSEGRRTTVDLQKASDVANSAALRQLTTFVTPGRSAGGFFGVTNSDFKPFNDAIQELNKEVRAGHPDYVAFEKSINDVVANNPGLQTTGDKILGIVAAATAAAAQLGNTAQAIKDINRSSVGNFDRTQQAGQDQSVMSQRFGDDPFSAAREQQRQKVIALKEAQDERNRSLDRTLDLARQDIELVGKTTAEVEGLRMAAQLEAQVREEAAKSNVAADEAEIARIRAKAAEYGKLKALEEARSTIFNQTQDIELQRSELGLVGQSTLAHDRAIASLKAEQEIRKLGIPLYGAEAEAIRKNTAELSNLAEALAKAKIQQDLLFEIRQAGRSEQDQSVASQLRSAGLPEDLDSDIAKVIKMKDEIAKMKDTWEEVFQTARDGIDGVVDALFDGGDIGDALKKVGRDFARQMFDLAATNPLKNWLTGSNLPSIADLGIFGSGATSGKGGGFGGVLGNLLGAQKAVASMQVQAASVFINGAPLGVPGLGSVGNLLNPGGSGFTPNSDLMDVLGGGAANQNGIQTRIDQAFGTLFSQDQIQSRISSAFGGSAGLGGIFSPSGGFASVLGGGGSTSARMTGGGGVAGQVWNFFAGKGLAPHQIAGIMGNVSAESGFNPMAVGDGGNALGLFQWNDRAPAMLNSIGGRGNLGDVGAQLKFAWKELQSSEGTAFKKLLGSTDVRGATSAFAGFERPKGFSWDAPEGAHNFVGRLSGAQDALSKFGSTASTATNAVGQLGGASTGALSNLVSSTSQAAGGLNALGSGAGKLGSMLGQFPAAPGGGGGGLFGGIGSWFGGLFGGGGGIGSFSAGVQADFASGALGLGLFADGTENAPPGWAVVGEKGPELRKLRAGDVIRSNPRSVDMMKQAGGASNDNLHDLVRMLAPHLKSNVRINNIFDPAVVGDYLNTSAGEEVIMNVLRRNNK